MMVWPSRLKVSSDRSASCSSARSTVSAATRCPDRVGQHARPPGGVQQIPADPGRRQHRHDLHHPGAHAALVSRPDRLQGQQHRLRHATRVRLPLASGSGTPRPAAPAAAPGTSRTPRAARRSPPRPEPAPAADAPARRPPRRLPRHPPGRSARPGTPAPRPALNTSTGTLVPRFTTGCRSLVISTRAAPPAGTNGRSASGSVRVVEHQQAAVPVGLQPLPHQPGPHQPRPARNRRQTAPRRRPPRPGQPAGSRCPRR